MVDQTEVNAEVVGALKEITQLNKRTMQVLEFLCSHLAAVEARLKAIETFERSGPGCPLEPPSTP